MNECTFTSVSVIAVSNRRKKRHHGTVHPAPKKKKHTQRLGSAVQWGTKVSVWGAMRLACRLRTHRNISLLIQLSQMLINVREEKRELVSWTCERNMRERRRVGKTRTERERGWANKGNKERMRLMAERSWHRATHSVVASKRPFCWRFSFDG